MSYQITKLCAKCHSCRMECPVSAIHFEGIHYVIDPNKCTECGHCIEICPVCAIINDKKPQTIESHERLQKHCDLVVAGGGGSGMVAAVKYAQLTGGKVIVLEKAKKIGGSTNLAHGFGAIYSKWQQDAGDPDVREQIVQNSLKKSGGLLDEAMIRKIIYSTGEFFDWLCSFGGAEEAFSLVDSSVGPQDASAIKGTSRIGFPERKFANLKCEDQAVGPGWMGTYVIRKMQEQCAALDIEILTGCAAEKLLPNETGAVSGVLARDAGGEVEITCDAVILATGCCSYNDEMVRKIEPRFFDVDLVRQSVPTCTGDGITMAESVGGFIDYENIRVAMAQPAHHPFGYSGYRYLQQPQTVIVNLNGKRYANESAPPMGANATAFLDQPKGYAYAVIDDALVETYSAKLIANPPDESEGWILKKYRQEIEEDSKNEIAILVGDTIEDLDREFNRGWGTPIGALAEELHRYNHFCEIGIDEDFGKDPRFLVPLKTGPFYAFYAQGFSEGTYGGIVTDTDMQVLTKSGEKIPGLYAVGDNAQGFNHRALRGPDIAPVSDLTWAMNSGYQAAISIAKRK